MLNPSLPRAEWVARPPLNGAALLRLLTAAHGTKRRKPRRRVYVSFWGSSGSAWTTAPIASEAFDPFLTCAAWNFCKALAIDPHFADRDFGLILSERDIAVPIRPTHIESGIWLWYMCGFSFPR